MHSGRHSTVIVGGGQSGLAVAYHLRRRRLPVVVLDENERIGDAWRTRWDSLRMFTPARYNGLPGMRFPGSPSAYPTKDEAAAYLEAYVRAFDLPVRTGVQVESLAQVGDGFAVGHDGDVLVAENVVVATGAYSEPNIPPFAHQLHDDVLQFHSSEYRTPAQVREGPVLVVGAGNSGAEIALELSAEHETWLSGRDTGQEPTRPGSLLDRLFTPVMWFMASRVLTVKTPFGRKVRDHFLHPPRGIPKARVRSRDLATAGIKRVPRVRGMRNGFPVLQDGTGLEVSTVIWCTGFRPDYSWIDVQIPYRHGLPPHDRGIVHECPGLYFVGLPFQYALSSALLGGVGRDAAHIVDHIASKKTTNRETRSL